MKHIALTILIIFFVSAISAQNVGIGTVTPQARFHVADSAVLFTGGQVIYNNPPLPPVSGSGTRLMWYPARAAFRAGTVSGNYWDAQNVGASSVAIGQNVTASGDRSAAFGYNTSARGSSSFAVGNNTVAEAANSIAMGFEARANNSHSVAIGTYAYAGAPNSMALGTSASTAGTQSVAIGSGTIAPSVLQTTVGVYNASVDADPTVWKETDPLFVVGNGSHSADRSTAMTILKNGNTGIGVLAPQAKLQVSGQVMIGNGIPQATFHVEGNQIIRRNSYTGAAHLTLEETQAGDGSRLQFRNPSNGSNYWDLFGLAHASSSADAFFNIYYEPTGNAMILRGNGNVWFRGSVSQNSDIRLKKNITLINNPLEKILKLNGYHYYWKDSLLDPGLQAGVLAQEVEQLMPELVQTAADGTKSVNYIGLVPYLVEAIKEQQKLIEKLLQKQ